MTSQFPLDEYGIPKSMRSPAFPTLGTDQPMSEVAPGTNMSSAGPIAAPATNNALKVPPVGQAQADQNEVSRLHSTGSGVDQYRKMHPIAGGILKGLSLAGSMVLPGLMAGIPGTDTHHQVLENKAQGNLAADTGIAEKQAQTQEAQARADALAHPKEEKPDNPQLQYIEAYQKAVAEGRNPETDATVQSLKKAIQDYADTTNKSQPKSPIIHETDQGIFLVDPETKQATPLTFNGEPLKPKPANQNFEEQAFAEWHQAHPNGTRLQFESERASATQKPDKDQKQLAIVDGKVVELRPGMTVPTGATDTKGAKIGERPVSPDEQKRADLVGNLNENLDQLEDIVNRRPDLFGKVSGRITKGREWLGSDDPDVAALKGVEDRLGMVQQSSHGMRSAQHVEESANSILNGFKNGAEAMKRAIADARKSGATFTQDVERKTANPSSNTKDFGAAPQGKAEGATGTLPDGTKVVVKGGRLVAR